MCMVTGLQGDVCARLQVCMATFEQGNACASTLVSHLCMWTIPGRIQ